MILFTEVQKQAKLNLAIQGCTDCVTLGSIKGLGRALGERGVTGVFFLTGVEQAPSSHNKVLSCVLRLVHWAYMYFITKNF